MQGRVREHLPDLTSRMRVSSSTSTSCLSSASQSRRGSPRRRLPCEDAADATRRRACSCKRERRRPFSTHDASLRFMFLFIQIVRFVMHSMLLSFRSPREVQKAFMQNKPRGRFILHSRRRCSESDGELPADSTTQDTITPTATRIT